MGEMTPRKRALLCMTGNKAKADRISCLDPLTTCTVDQMNAVGAPFPEAHTNPDLAFKLAAAAWTVVGLEGFKMPFDLCVEAEAMGAKLNWGRIDRHPSVETHVFNELADLKIPENIMERGRYPLKFKVEERLKREYGDYLPVVNQVTGPFTLAGHLFGIEKFCVWTKKKPLEQVKQALMDISELNIEDCRNSLRSGADMVCVADPSATSDILSPEFFKTVMVPVYQNMSKKIGAPLLLHICGNTTSYLPYMPDTGIDALSVDAQVDIGFAKAILGRKVAICGGVPTITTLLFGTPEKVKEAAINAIKSGVDMLMPSCGIPPRTPLANFRALVDVARCMVYN
jgi:[methyl-Co(III) methanol-specific corrinoid protein]:coenzyme M methyltransferase